MLKLQTPVEETAPSVGFSYGDRILLVGSCFSDNIGKVLIDCGFDAMVNPFGTLYNPASIRSALRRLASGEEFTQADCVAMGAGSDKICSFSHHTSFARATVSEFLENANSSLRAAAEFFRGCTKVVITLGTAWCFRYVGMPDSSPMCSGPGSVPLLGKADSDAGTIVANCLKRDAAEFSRERLTPDECVRYLCEITDICAGRDIIFTVSPIRHLSDGAHGNLLSKSTLLLAIDRIISDRTSQNLDYFPAYEIMTDELRDYRFYAEDMVHPSAQAVNYIAERFLSRHLSPADRPRLEAAALEHKRSLHRPISR